MVYRKRSTRVGAKKYPRRGRRLYASRRSAIRSMISKRRPHYFSRLTNTGTLVLTSNITYAGFGFASRGMDFQIDNATKSPPDNHLGVVVPADFTTLYDRYKILKVVVQVKWSLPFSSETIPGVNIADNLINNAPILYYFRDYDDRNAPTVNDIMERSDAKKVVLTPNKFINISLRPAILNDSDTGGTRLVKWRQWIDMANPGQPHNGLKIACVYPGNTAYGVVSYQARIYFACKDAR